MRFIVIILSCGSHWSEGQRGREGGGQRRSPLDVIMNQIRKKRTASDRKPLGRFLSWTSDRKGIPEDGETEGREEERGRSSGVVSQLDVNLMSLPFCFRLLNSQTLSCFITLHLGD